MGQITRNYCQEHRPQYKDLHCWSRTPVILGQIIQNLDFLNQKNEKPWDYPSSKALLLYVVIKPTCSWNSWEQSRRHRPKVTAHESRRWFPMKWVNATPSLKDQLPDAKIPAWTKILNLFRWTSHLSATSPSHFTTVVLCYCDDVLRYFPMPRPTTANGNAYAR